MKRVWRVGTYLVGLIVVLSGCSDDEGDDGTAGTGGGTSGGGGSSGSTGGSSGNSSGGSSGSGHRWLIGQQPRWLVGQQHRWLIGQRQLCGLVPVNPIVRRHLRGGLGIHPDSMATRNLDTERHADEPRPLCHQR